MDKKIRNSALVSYLLIFATGCASVGVGGRKQVVKITSDPPGAEILYKGKNLGTTPKYIKVEAGYKPKLKLRSPDKQTKKEIEIPTTYRWGKSFFSNMVFLTLAPIGWTVDAITGGAWEVLEPKTVSFPNDQTEPKNLERPVLAIAPPDIGSPEFSNQVGYAIEEQIKGNQNYQVMSFEATQPLFYYMGDGDPLPEDQENKEELFYQLKNQLVLTSKAEVKNDQFHVSSQVRDIYSGETVEEFNQVFAAGGDALNAQLFMTNKLGQYFYFLPNTFFVNLGSNSQAVTINNVDYQGKVISGDSFIDQVGQVVERINISRLEPYQRRRINAWSFKFIPDIHIANSNIEYKKYAPLEDVEFQRTLVSLGYGLRLAYIATWGRPYIDLIPHFGWTKIKSQGGAEDFDVSETSGFLSAELGYVYFMTPNWVLKFFTRSFNENRRLWEETIQRSTNSTDRITSNNSVFSGISFGYQFGLKTNKSVLRKVKRK